MEPNSTEKRSQNFFSLLDAAKYMTSLNKSMHIRRELVFINSLEIVDTPIIFEFESDLFFSCGFKDVNCSISFKGNGQILSINSNLTLAEFDIYLDGNCTQALVLINASSALFQNIRITPPPSKNEIREIIRIENSFVSLENIIISGLLASKYSSIFKTVNSSSINIKNLFIQNSHFDKNSNIIVAEKSYINIENLYFKNISAISSNPEHSKKSNMIEFSESCFLLSGITIEDALLENFTLLQINLPSRSTFSNNIKGVRLLNARSNKGSVIALIELKQELNLVNLIIENCSFEESFVLEIRNSTDWINLSQVVIWKSFSKSFIFFSSAVYVSIQDVQFSSLTNFQTDSNLIKFEKFQSIRFSNVSLFNFITRNPAFIFQNLISTQSSLIFIYKCNFLHTVVPLTNDPSSTGGGTLTTGAILCFLNVKEVYINRTIFKNNSILDPSLVLGSAALYFNSRSKDSLIMSDCLFLSNQVVVGPFLVYFNGYIFGLFNSFISNSMIPGPSPQGFSALKIVGSFIRIDKLITLDIRISDGLINIIESFTINKIEVNCFIAINNTAAKRGAGSLLLDGNSKDREVFLRDSVFINNAANTQNAAGIHMFHTTIFWRLNITYERNKHYHNVASLGTDWWIRVAKKNAFLWITNCEFHSSYTFNRTTDFGVFYLGGWEPGSFLTAKNSLFNRSSSKAYGFYIKDIYVFLENITLRNQTASKAYSSLLYIEGGGMSLNGCTFEKQSNNYNLFNVRDNASLTISNSKFLDLALSSLFFRIIKTRLSIFKSQFSNISCEFLIYIVSAGNEQPISFNDCIFSHIFSKLVYSVHSAISFKGSLFMDIFSNMFVIDSSNFLISSGQIIRATQSNPNMPCLMKSSESNITIDSVSLSNVSGAILVDIFFLRSGRLFVNDSQFFNINGGPVHGLMTTIDSSISFNNTNFVNVLTYVVKSSRSAINLNSCLFTSFPFYGQKKERSSYFLFNQEVLTSNITFNVFTNALFSKSAFLFTNMASFQHIKFSNNICQDIHSDSKGSCLNVININTEMHSNIFIRNSALEAGAVFIFCEINEIAGFGIDCKWSLVNNIFLDNKAINSAGALEWLFIPPLSEENNLFIGNLAGDGLEFTSYPIRLTLLENEVQPIKDRPLLKVKNQKSGMPIEFFEMTALDSYGQRVRSLEKLNIEVLSDESMLECYDLEEKLCPFKQFLRDNKFLTNAYKNFESPYQYKKPNLFGRTLIFQNKIEKENKKSGIFKIEGTYINGPPSFTVFLNITSPDFPLFKKNFNKSSLLERVSKEKQLNEIVTATSYSFIIPVVFDFCREGEYLDYERGYCLKCGAGFLNFEQNQTECKHCPDGLICKGGNETEVEAGYWRSSKTTEVIYECNKIEGSCLGGLNATCADTYEGNLCFECKYSTDAPMEKTYSKICRPCSPTGSLIFISISFWIILFFVCWVLARAYFGNEKAIKKRVIIKCLINYYHTFLMLNDYNLNPSYFLQSYLKWVNSISQGVSFWFSMDCFSKIVSNSSNVYYRYLFEIIFFHIFIFIFIFSRFKLIRDPVTSTRNIRKLDEAAFIWYLFYPSLFDYLLRRNMCISINGIFYLMEAPNEQCYSSEGKAVLVISFSLFLIWNLIFPVIIYKTRGKYRILDHDEKMEHDKESHNFRIEKKKISFNIGSEKQIPCNQIIKIDQHPPNQQRTDKSKPTIQSSKNQKFILYLYYRERGYIIEFYTYIFKLAIYAVNSLPIDGSVKILALWPFVLYSQIIETQFWKFVVFQLQKYANFLINLNFLLLSYACLWLTIGNRFYSDIFFFSSFIFQFLILGLLTTSYFEFSVIIRSFFSRFFKRKSEKCHPH